MIPITEIVGYSSTPTSNRVTVHGETSYVKCAADVLLNGSNRDVEGESRCPVCQGAIFLKLSQGCVVESDPSEMVLYAVEVESEGGMICVVCEESYLFDKQECLDEWLRSHKGQRGEISKPQEYLDHCAMMGCC